MYSLKILLLTLVVLICGFESILAQNEIRKTSLEGASNSSSLSVSRQADNISTLSDYTYLKVTELNYHPPDIIIGIDTIPGKYYEFIEFKNTGESSIDLGALVLDSAVYYEFPSGYLLPPGEFFVIVTKPTYFYFKYGMEASGNCQDYFGNAGEYVLLRDTIGTKIFAFYYDDEIPFPESPDGDGYTLSASEVNPTLGLENYRYWMASSVIGGSPFADDPSLVGIESIASTETGSFKIFPNPSNRYLFIKINEENISGSNNLTIVSLAGSVVYKCSFTDNITLDLAEILSSKGLYILNIIGEKGTQTGKIMYAP